MAVDARSAQDRVAGEAAGQEDAEEALFAAVREHAEAMIAWARGEQALSLEHGVPFGQAAAQVSAQGAIRRFLPDAAGPSTRRKRPEQEMTSPRGGDF